MESPSKFLLKHALLLAVLCIAIIGIWALPVFLAGFPFHLPSVVHYAQDFAETGLVEPKVAFVSLILWLLHPLVGWQNMIGWTLVGAAFFAASLVPWWWGLQRLFNARIAWIASLLLALMPAYWTEAVQLSGYPVAFLFLFLGFALYIGLYPRNSWAGVTASGICFGLTLAAAHTFITFLPWFLLVHFWQQRYHWKGALAEAGLYCAVAYIAFVAPLIPNAIRADLSPLERLAVFAPAVQEHTTGVYHLYPDEYTYQFLRDEFEEIYLKDVEQSSFLARQDNQNYRYLFGVGDANIVVAFMNGIWLLLNALPQLFLLETVGGAVLWLLILPGMVLVYRQRPWFFWALCGLWLSMELILRFGFHYSRSHFIDVGWIAALFAAVGAVWGAHIVHERSRRIPSTTALVVITLLVSAQLVQANRMLFARLYAKSNTPAAYAVAAVLDDLPADAVIAYPRGAANLLFFSQHNSIDIHEWTIDYLAERGRLKEPFEHYGVTHIIGYDENRTKLITSKVPGLETISYSEDEFTVPLTPLNRLLLHVIR